MIGAAALVVLASLAPQANGVEATATLEPVDAEAGAAGVHIGQPLHFTITLKGNAAKGATLAEDDLELGYAWSVVDGPRDAVDASLPAVERAAVRLQWTLIALESGGATTPAVEFELVGGEALVAPPATIEVLPELGEGEDAPRPLLGFRDVEDRRLGDPRLVVAAAIGLLALPLLIVGFVRFRKRPRTSASAGSGFTPRQAIEALDPAVDPRGAMSALGPLLRRALDETLGCDHSSLTDAEWVLGVEISDGLSEDDRRAAAQLLQELSAVRFGGGDPTSFAAKDALERARRLAALTIESREVPA